MELMGIKLLPAGRPVDKEIHPMPYKPEVGEGRKTEKVYPCLYGSSETLPLNLEGCVAGDKLLLISVVNIKSMSDEDRDGVGKSDSFELEVLQAGAKKIGKKKLTEATTKELYEAVTNGTVQDYEY